jgi:excisionase family DNA binding protein
MPYPSISDGPFLNTDEAAAMLGVHPKTLQRLARSGHVRAYRIGSYGGCRQAICGPMLPFAWHL